MTPFLLFTALAITCSIGTIGAGLMTIRYSRQATRDLQRATEYRRETEQIRAETDALRQQRRGR